MSTQPSPTLAGFQIAVSNGQGVAVLDLLNHPCAEHILGDIDRAGASSSVAGIAGAELVAGVVGAEPVAEGTGGELVAQSTAFGAGMVEL